MHFRELPNSYFQLKMTVRKEKWAFNSSSTIQFCELKPMLLMSESRKNRNSKGQIILL